MHSPFERKSRNPQRMVFPWLRGLWYSGIGSLLFFFCNRLDTGDLSTFFTGKTLTPVIVSVTKDTYKTCTRLFTHLVKSGDTFQSILAQCNISAQDISSYYALLKSSGFTRLFPGDSLIVKQEENTNNTSVSLLNKFSFWYHLDQTDSMLHVERKPLELTKYTCMIKGTLLTSFSEDVASAGGDDALVFKFTDIFAWDINFFVDPRPGDQFEILFEKYFREGKFSGYGNILAAKYRCGTRTFYAIGMEDSQGNISYFDENGKAVQKDFLKAPLRFSRISSPFTYRRKHPLLGIVRPHLGIDYAAAQGTPVYSAADGIVRSAAYNRGFGNQIEISHGATHQTMYGHLQRFAPGIHSGVFVKQGELIGFVGATGMTTGTHLDYRMKINKRFVNPFTSTIAAKKGVSSRELEQFFSQKHIVLSMLENRMKTEGFFVLEIGQEIPSEVDQSCSVLLSNVHYGTNPRS